MPPSKEAVTIRLDPQKRAERDALAPATARDRSFLVNEAIDAYLTVHRWRIARIKDGLRQADSGAFATGAEVSAGYARW